MKAKAKHTKRNATCRCTCAAELCPKIETRVCRCSGQAAALQDLQEASRMRGSFLPSGNAFRYYVL